MEIIGHRGAMWDAPENTLASFKMGWEQKADIVECDVRLTADGRIVTIHDATTGRTAGIDLTVAQTTSDELRKLDVGRFKGEQFVGEKIPFLEEVLEIVPPYGKLFVEVKCGTEILTPLKQVVADSGKAEQVTLIGFDLEVVTEAKKMMPQQQVYWLLRTPRDAQGNETEYDPNIIDIVAKRGLDGPDLHYAGLTPKLARDIKAAGQKLYVWVVNEPDLARRLIDMGIDGLGTDRPGWLR
ncbi:MAG: glycerophosphodiester phosphodiesterase, partial [Armatimonadetes bacterium]|nr:glycerophosphodiester phosphodiesterase [Armatimonadota bacterium]